MIPEEVTQSHTNRKKDNWIRYFLGVVLSIVLENVLSRLIRKYIQRR